MIGAPGKSEGNRDGCLLDCEGYCMHSLAGTHNEFTAHLQGAEKQR
jgi:hypothetical protein